jgi:hypothetical protein
VLHITNGDTSAARLEAAAIEGTIVPWREALSEGPAPSLAAGAEWIETRATFLSNGYRVGFEGVHRQLTELEGRLSSAHESDEIVLWFDQDLFCQANFLYLLARLALDEKGSTKISRVYSSEREIGRMSSVEIASLLETRIPITREDLDLGVRGWQVFSSPDPRLIETFLAEPTGRLPHLNEALRLHLERFPSTFNGLGTIDQWLLERIAEGERSFVQLFSRFTAEKAGYGLGDWQIWRTLEHLARCTVPLLTLGSDIEQDRAPIDADLAAQTYTLTDAGRQVLAGDADNMERNGSDRWLGGVHLGAEGKEWRWDRATATITSRLRQ